MANFRTHAVGGLIASGGLASFAYVTELAPQSQLIVLTLAGTFGSVLPDVDLQNSRASRALFTVFGVVAAFAVLFNVVATLSVVEMWLLWLATFAVVRLCLHHAFHNYTRHRGGFHSILGGAAFATALVVLSYYGFGLDASVAWLTGVFLFTGYLVHLSLDELYSVDFLDTRVKRSFGTAMKLFDHKEPVTTALLLAACVSFFLLTPSMADLRAHVMTAQFRTSLQERVLPRGRWFQFKEHRAQDDVATLKPSIAEPASSTADDSRQRRLGALTDEN
ncbi:MAG: metal-dependent hydrolase [Pseudomonadota bacterium]